MRNTKQSYNRFLLNDGIMSDLARTHGGM